jgi:hypothetical protein
MIRAWAKEIINLSRCGKSDNLLRGILINPGKRTEFGGIEKLGGKTTHEESKNG